MPEHIPVLIEPTHEIPSSPRTGCLARARGAMLIVGALGVAALGWLVLFILDDNLRGSPDHAQRMHYFALWLIDQRLLVPLATMPAALIGVWLLARRPTARDLGATWLLTALGTLLLVAVFAAVLIAFVQFLLPLYQYQPL